VWGSDAASAASSPTIKDRAPFNIMNVIGFLMCLAAFGAAAADAKKVCFYSDTHNNVKIHKKIVEQSEVFKPDLVISAGDATDEPYGYVDFLAAETRINKTFVVIGNHDADDYGRAKYYNDKSINYGVKYRSINDTSFVLPFDENTLMIGIDCFTKDILGQIAWLDEQLKKNAHANVVIVQHSDYSCGVYKAFEDVDKRLRAWTLKNNNRVRIIIAGNIHDYARANVDGIVRVTIGPAGGELRSCAANCSPPPVICVSATYNYMMMDTNTCTCTTLDINNKVLDTFAYKCDKPTPTPTPDPEPEQPESTGEAPPEPLPEVTSTGSPAPPAPDTDDDPVCMGDCATRYIT
jgi:3',5'-cyclic AMP phosphodiesterase CpdA